MQINFTIFTIDIKVNFIEYNDKAQFTVTDLV